MANSEAGVTPGCPLAQADSPHNADIHFRGVSAPVGIGPLKAAREGYAGGKKGIKGFPTFPRGGKKQGIRGEPIRR